MILFVFIGHPQHLLKGVRVVLGFVPVDKQHVLHHAVLVVEVVEIHLELCTPLFRAEERNVDPTGLHACLAALSLVVDGYRLDDELAEQDLTPIAIDVHVRLFAQLVPGSVEVLRVEVDVVPGYLPGECYVRRQVRVFLVELVAVLTGEIYADVADIDISSLLVGVVVLLQSVLNEIVVGVLSHREKGEVKRYVSVTAVIEVRYVGFATSCDNVADEEVFATPSLTCYADGASLEHLDDVA